MIEVKCDSCGEKIKEATAMFDGLGQRGIESIADTLDDLFKNLERPEPTLEVTPDLLAAVGLAASSIKMIGKFYCEECFARLRETGKMAPCLLQ